MSPMALRKTRLYAPSNLRARLRKTSIRAGGVRSRWQLQIWCMMTSVSVLRVRWLLSSSSNCCAEVLVVGQLAVEGDAEPLPLFDVVPLEGLGVAAVVVAAGGVADVPDRGPAGVLVHEALGLAAVVEPKRLDDAADLLVGVENLLRPGNRWSCRPPAGRDFAGRAACAASGGRFPRAPAGHNGLTPRPAGGRSRRRHIPRAVR